MRLSYVAVVCFGFVLAAYSHPKKHIDNRNEDKQRAINTSSPEEQCSTSRQTIQDPSHHDAHGGSRTVGVVSLPARNWLDKSAILINGILAVTGVGGILVAIGTLRKIERQTKATEIQAAHMVESARPFLMIEVLGDENNASFQVCNRGISPAKILFINRLLLPTYLPIGKSLPLVPDYGQQYRNIVDFSINAEPVNAEWISPAGQTFIGTVFPKSELALLRSASPHTQIGPSVVWHFGVVVYKGLFGPKCYESRYCYRLFGNQCRMLGPYEYNEFKRVRCTACLSHTMPGVEPPGFVVTHATPLFRGEPFAVGQERFTQRGKPLLRRTAKAGQTRMKGVGGACKRRVGSQSAGEPEAELGTSVLICG